MLAVQEYLKTNSIESLEKFGIFAKYHPTKPYVILDYDMVESSKHKEDPKVCECRGLVLRTIDHSIIHKSFNRFFNLNEASCTDKFDWTSFSTSTKEDGSLIKVRWYDGELLITTRNSFASTEVGDSELTWADMVERCLYENKDRDQLECIQVYNDCTFVFEFCSPHNTVVVNHAKPKLVLLGVFDSNGVEIHPTWVDDIAKDFGFNRPQTFDFKSLDEVIAYLDKLEEAKDDTEGVVLKDKNGVRLKAKSKWYLKLHRLSGNGNIALTKNILPLCLQGEKDEVISYFPYLAPKFEEVEKILADLLADLHNVWWTAQEIVEQKKFALYITRDNPTPFSSLLFSMKKEGNMTYDNLKSHWNKSSDLILKVLN